MHIADVLHYSKKKFSSLLDKHKLRDEAVRVVVGALSPEQAIGNVIRNDYALRVGKEVMIQAEFKGYFGQAFTTCPRDFSGTLCDILKLDMNTISDRAVFIAAMNAVCAYLGVAGKVLHCRNREPEDCGRQIAREILDRYEKIAVGLVGFQLAILENLAEALGVGNVRCSDLDSRNIGTVRFGVAIRDGNSGIAEMAEKCDLLLVTGSTVVNNTLDAIYREVSSNCKHVILFGVTCAGVAALCGLPRICPLGH